MVERLSIIGARNLSSCDELIELEEKLRKSKLIRKLTFFDGPLHNTLNLWSSCMSIYAFFL
jgi:hypothetical protein